MKKVLLALLLVSFLATSVFAWDAIGGKIGVGVKELDFDGDPDGPFISYDPYSIPQLQLRLTPIIIVDRNNNEDMTSLSLAALYKLGEGDVIPYLGMELGIAGYKNIAAPANDYTRETLKLILGAEWAVQEKISLIFDLNLFTTYTSKDPSGAVVDHVISYFGVTNATSQGWATIGLSVSLD